MRPLHKPEPRRRDRRAGPRSAHLRDVLRQPTGGRRGGRDPADKRRAIGRLLDRYLIGRSSLVASLLALVAALIVAGATVHLATQSNHLVPYAGAEADYDRLVALARQSCETGGPCTFGWSNPEPPPPGVRALMARVRARDVPHDLHVGRTTIRGAYAADFTLVHLQPPADLRPQRRRYEAERDSVSQARSAAQGRTRPDRNDLGGGWTQWEGRH